MTAEGCEWDYTITRSSGSEDMMDCASLPGVLGQFGVGMLVKEMFNVVDVSVVSVVGCAES